MKFFKVPIIFRNDSECAYMLFSDENHFILIRIMGYGRRQGECYIPVTTVVRRGVVSWCGQVLASFRTYLHLVDGTVTSQCYLNNTIKPIIIPLHIQHRQELFFMDDYAPAHCPCIITVHLQVSYFHQLGNTL